MAVQTVFYDSDGWVRCVEDGDSSAVVHGCEKASSDSSVHGELTTRHTITVSGGEVTSAEYNEPVTPIEALRARKDAEIKEYALSLMQSSIPALDSFAMVAFLKTIWPTLTDPTSQPDLDYCRQVYEHAMTRLDQLSTADRETIEGYDPAEDTGWP